MSPALAEKKLPPALRHESAGDTVVQDVKVEVREDSFGAEAVFIVLVLSDPPGDRETWPVDDLWELRRAARRVVADKLPELNVPWFVAFEPEHPDLPDDDAAVQIEDE